MVHKLIVFGIDGMDRDVVLRYKDELPNIYGMMKESGFPQLRSVFPADTTPAWSTIYTGQDPSEHGILNFVNLGAKKNTYEPLTFEDSVFQGKTFWDVLNDRGLTCAVLLPMNIKQGWKINGLMITRPCNGRMRVYPEERRSLYCPNSVILGTESKYTSEHSLGTIRDEFFAKVEEEIRLTDLALEHENVDVLFAYFSTTDGVQHEFWKYCNPNHPLYPGTNPFGDTIRDMYIRMDKYIGSVRKKYPDTPMLIISDHGHGARPVYTVRINELLRRGGFLTPKEGNTKNVSFKKTIKRTIKSAVMKTIKTIGLPSWAVKLAKRFPIWKSVFASGKDFDWEHTQAYMSDLSAVKNYSYGGIRLNDNVEDKDALADKIIEYLRPVRIDGEEKSLFEWIVRTNTFYHGKHLDKYPEIVFQMDERYGGEWELGEKVFDRSGTMHMVSSGGHRWRTAVIAADHVQLDHEQYEMTKIFKLILQVAGSETNG